MHLVVVSMLMASRIIELLPVLRREATQDVLAVMDVAQILINTQNQTGIERGTILYRGVNLDFD